MKNFIYFLIFLSSGTLISLLAHAAMNDYQKVRLRSLDKITARTMTFDARVGTTIKFGSMYIKILSCQKPDLSERDDAAAFLQIWEISPDDVSKWIFSGWMFASSPALSAMDHPIYDVWVINCLDGIDSPKKETSTSGPSIETILQKTAPLAPELSGDPIDTINAAPPSTPLIDDQTPQSNPTNHELPTTQLTPASPLVPLRTTDPVDPTNR